MKKQITIGTIIAVLTLTVKVLEILRDEGVFIKVHEKWRRRYGDEGDPLNEEERELQDRADPGFDDSEGELPEGLPISGRERVLRRIWPSRNTLEGRKRRSARRAMD